MYPFSIPNSIFEAETRGFAPAGAGFDCASASGTRATHRRAARSILFISSLLEKLQSTPTAINLRSV